MTISQARLINCHQIRKLCHRLNNSPNESTRNEHWEFFGCRLKDEADLQKKSTIADRPSKTDRRISYHMDYFLIHEKSDTFKPSTFDEGQPPPTEQTYNIIRAHPICKLRAHASYPIWLIDTRCRYILIKAHSSATKWVGVVRGGVGSR